MLYNGLISVGKKSSVKSVQTMGISGLHVILETTLLDALSIDFTECGTIGGGTFTIL